MNLFSYSLQRHVYLAALAYYLKEEKLLQKDEAAKWYKNIFTYRFFLMILLIKSSFLL